MAKGGGDFIASWAFHIGIGALHQALFVFPLLFWRGMKEILCERHVLLGRSSLPEGDVDGLMLVLLFLLNFTVFAVVRFVF